MKNSLKILILLPLIVFVACENEWDKHYSPSSEQTNTPLWDDIQRDANFSLFVQYIKEYNLDTLFKENRTYTLFIPTNEAISAYLDTSQMNESLLRYHISTFFIQLNNLSDKRKIQTLSEKYALFNKSGDEIFLDGIPILSESPLLLNGKYYTIGSVAVPRPNIYEYYAQVNPILKKYFDSKDSVVLDKELSKPIGFDEHGNTIYDTVSDVINTFETKYFPIKHEFRNKTATLVFPKEEDYNNALTAMAQDMNSVYQDYKDIPMDWQNKILIPYLLRHGVFENMVEEVEFVTPTSRDTVKLKNILGDSIVIDYDVTEKTICSNGYAYNYKNFRVPDTLYKASVSVEGESLLKSIGINRYSWLDSVKLVSDVSFAPMAELVPTASNDSILRVLFTKGYAGNFSVSFNISNLFPRKYLMIVNTHMYVGGIYEIYVNDVLVKTWDYYSYVKSRELYTSVTGKRYGPTGPYNRFDCWVENLTEYGKAEVKFVYKGPSTVLNNGLVIDNIRFIPYN